MKIFLTLLAVLLLTGCADSVTFEQAIVLQESGAVSGGFWWGLWNGLTVGCAFIGSLFSDEIALYDIYNNGGWYDFGFWVGCVLLLGSCR
jgi:hypothetical protein